MCGRGACTLDPTTFHKEVSKRLGKPVTECKGREGGLYNVSPGSHYPLVRCGGEEMVLGRWGLDGAGGRFVVNARGEGVAEKAMFRKLTKCVMFLSGFYEWQQVEKDKQPYYFHLKNGDLLPVACLLDEKSMTYAVITTSSSSSLKWIHHRMPVILSDEGVAAWLDPEKPLAGLKNLVTGQFEGLAWHPVTKSVGKVSYNTPECVKEVKLEEKSKKRTITIDSFFAKKSKVQKTDVIDLDSDEGKKDEGETEIDFVVLDPPTPADPPTQAAGGAPLMPPPTTTTLHPLVAKFRAQYEEHPSSIVSLVED